MSTLSSFADALATGQIEIIDLTAPLSSETPVIQLPPQFRTDRAVRAGGAQPVRRPRPGLVLEQLPLMGASELETVRFPGTDFAAIAHGYGFEALTVRDMGDLQGVAGWVAGPRSAPLLIDAKVTRR
jgi:hypothetical protein